VRWALAEDTAKQIRVRYLGREGHTQRIVGLGLGRGESGGLSRRLCDEILGRLAERGARILLFFPLSQGKLAAQLKRSFVNYVVPVAQEDMATVAALLQGCEVLISGNTDLLHLGIALEVPTVALFDRDPGRWVAAGCPVVRVVQCTDLASLPVGQVVGPVEQVLNRK